MSPSAELAERARLLREAFDASFAREPERLDAGLVDFLVVQAGADRFALRLAEVAAVHIERKVRRVLSPLSELLGLADFRGILTPIYGVSALLGRPSADDSRFLVVVRHAQPIGFAFRAFERHLRVTQAELALDDISEDPFTRGAVRHDGSTLRILQLTALVSHLARRLESLATKER